MSLAFYFVCALATHASGLWQPMHADYSCWLRVARDWRAGAVLYRETYDNKLPWVYRWVRAVDSARPEISCYLAESVLAAAGATLFAAALRPSFPRISPLVSVLLILWTGTSETFYGAQTTEAFALWCDVAAIGCWALAAQKGSPAWAFAAGIALVLTVTFRPPAVVHVIAWLPFLWLAYRRHSRKAAARNCAAALLGSIGMLALFCLDAVSSDWGSELPVVLARNARYGSLVPVAWGTSLFTAGATVARIVLGSPIALVFLVMTLVVWSRPPRRVPLPRKCWILAAILWCGAALAGAWPGGRHYAHYYHLLWPPLALLAALWLCRAWDVTFSKRVQEKLIVGVAAGSIIVAVLQQTYSAARAYRDDAQGQRPQTAVLEAARFLRRATSDTTPVVVHVWLDGAELYWRVPRPAPSFAIPHVLPRELFDQWAAATLAHPPEFIVWDGTPWQGVDGPPNPVVAERFKLLLAQEYRRVERYGELSVFRRNSNPN
ncbi:MAG: hypothetical protein WD063_10375 [Pirellulales bacterium]